MMADPVARVARRTTGAWLGMPACALCFFLGWFLFDVYRSGSASFAVKAWQGQGVVLPDTLHVDWPDDGRAIRLNLPIYNSLGRNVTIVGGTVTCSCVVIDDLPAVIEPHSRITLPLTVRSPGIGDALREFDQQIFLYTDLPRSPVLTVVIRIHRPLQ